MEGGMKCLKYMLFLLNLIFTLCGLGVVAVGVLAYVDQSEIKTLMQHANVDKDGVIGEVSQSEAAIICIIVGGAVLALVSMAGCYGAVAESKSLLIFYFCFLLITFLVEVAAGILGFFFYDKVTVYVGKYIGTAVTKEYGKAENKALTKAIDQLNQKFECCGFFSPNDWNNHTVVQGVPFSCCKYQNGTDCSDHPDQIYQTGCIDAIVNWIKDKILYVGAFAVAVAVTQIFGMAVSMCLCKAWQEDEVMA